MSRQPAPGTRRRGQRLVAVAIAAIVSITSFIPAAAAVAAPADPSQAPDSGPITTTAAQPAARVELPERRTATSATFDLGDGRLVTEFSADPIHYQRAGSTDFLPIELDFRTDGASGLARVDAAPVRVAVGRAADGIVALEWDDRRIAFRPLPAAALGELGATSPSPAELDTLAPLPTEAPLVSGRAADVAGILAGVGLRVVAQPYGAKSFLVLDRPIPESAFTFLVSAPGLTLRATERGALEFVDDATGAPIGEMPAPYAVDSTPDAFTGSGRTTTDVRYALGSLGTNQTVTITVDPAWLASAVYPVYVDPTTTIYNAGSSAYGDVHVNEGNPSFNYANYLRPDAPGYYEMWLGESPSNATYWNEAYVKFDLSGIAGQVVDTASLEVRPYHQYYDAPTATNTYVRRVTATWTEAITWATKAPYTNTGVTYTGCVEGQQCAFNVLGWVRDWVDEDLDNYGVHLSEIGTDNVRRGPTYWKRLIASEEGGSIRPRLIVTHHDPTTAVYPVSGPTSSRTLSWAVDPLWGQTRFHVDVASDPGFGPTTIVATSGDVAGTATSWAIPPATALAEGATYYWQVRSDHGTNAWGDWATGSFVHDLTLLGSQPQQRTEGWDLGGGDSLAVNAATLNAVVSHPIVSLPIRGGSLGLNLVHNAQDPVSVGMGRGWRLDAFRRLAVNPTNGEVTLTDGTGARHTFKTPSGTPIVSYTRPATIYATLSRDTTATPDRFTLTYRDKSVDVFDELSSNAGYLVAEKDRFQNTITYAYSGTNLVTIDDPVGRRIDLTWTGTNLTQIADWAYVLNGEIQATATGSRRTHRFFYDGADRLIGWADPLNTAATCPATPTQNTASHLTCLGYDAAGYLATITKAQTVATLSGGVIGTAAPRSITTQIDHAGTSEVRDVRDAEQYEGLDPATTIRRTAGLVEVVRQGTPDTTTRYAVPGAADPYGRIGSVKRKHGTAWIEQRTTYDTTYLIEPASVVDNYVNGIVGDGSNPTVDDRTTSWTYVANSLGLVARMTEPLTASINRITDYTYNTNNDLTQTIVNRSPADASQPPVTTRYCYDAGCSTNPASPTLTMSRRIENYVDGTAGNGAANVEDITTTYQYDMACPGPTTCGLLIRETRANYNAAGTLLDSAATGHTYDATGNLTADIVNYANGAVASPGDDITPNATTNARTDLTTTHTYDTAGNRISSADPRRAIEAAKGTSLGPDDYVSRSTYDPLGQALSTRQPTTPSISDCSPTPGCRTTTSTFDELGGVRESVDLGGVVTATEADRLGRAIRTFEDTDGAGSALAAITSEATYDAAGRMLTARDRRQVADVVTFGETANTFDELGRLTDTLEGRDINLNDAVVPADSLTHRVFDALDRQTTETAGSGGSAAQTTATSFDLGGRATSTDDEFTCTSTTYDYRDQPMAITEGQATGVCSGTGTRTTTISIDRLGRVTLRAVTAGTGTGDQPENTTYDGAGNILVRSGTQGGVTTTSTYTLNLLDQVIVETRTDGSTAKTNYDAAGNVTDRCYWQTGTAGPCLAVGTTPWANPPTQASTTVSDARNQRISQTSKLGASSTVATTTYDPNHNYLISAFYLPTHYNGAGERDAEAQDLYQYDARHRLTSITHQRCAVTPGTDTCTGTVTSLGSSAYTYDDNDNRTTVTESSTGGAPTTVTYCYDALNRLVAAKATTSCASAPTETYTYDDAGNRLTATVSGSTRTFTYDAEGQLASCAAPACAVTYDATGRSATITDDGVIWTYAYDADGRLITACSGTTCSGSGFDRVDYLYDGSGHRIQIKETTAAGAVTTTDFRYQADAVVQELVDGTVTRTYATDDAGRIVQVCDPDCATGTIYVVTWNGHGDATGLWRQETSGALALANSYTYSTWGTPTTTVASGFTDLKFRFLYVGAFDVQWDNSFGSLGLTYMHARHYSSSLGRFIQPDPSAQDDNLYVYAEDSPATKADPEGTMTISAIVVNAAAGASFEKRYTETVKRFGWTVESVRRYERVKGYGRGRYVDLIISKQTRTGFQRWRIELKVGMSRHVGEPQMNKDMKLTQSTGDPTRLVRSIQGSGGSGIVRVDYVITSGPKGPAVTFKFEGGQWRHGMPRGLGSGGGGGADGKLLL